MGKMAENPSKEEPLNDFFRAVTSNNISEVKKMITIGTAGIHDTDASGMNALMHAAYKGNAEMCQMLLGQGSDVNADTHSHAYMALHFAALSGSLEAIQILLDAGARTYKTNSVGRTPAQMAGFVGQPQCASLINNHLHKSELDKFTKPTSEHQTTRLHPDAQTPLHSLIMQVNLHPVSLTLHAIELGENLLNHLKDASNVLDKLSRNEVARSDGVNEVICLKLYYLSYLLDTLNTHHQKYIEEKEKMVAPFNQFLKKLLKTNKDGGSVGLEVFLRGCIRAFYAPEMPLYLQVARGMHGPEVRALDALSGAINGPRGFAPENYCVCCEREGKDYKKCSQCMVASYCSRECQKLHWSNHKKFCKKSESSETIEKMTENMKISQ